MKKILLLLLCPTLLFAADTPAPVPSPSTASAAASPNPRHPVQAVQDTETKEQRDARLAWWRAARFGMFIHWGLYAVPGGIWQGKPVHGIGEWIMNIGKIPVADYKKLAAQFNPTAFNADAIVSVAKAAGMKYIIITAKHHDGFAMYHSAANKFNIYDATPFKRDPLAELNAACQKQGLKLGFYYSQNQDWTAPGGVAYGSGHWDKAQDGDYNKYIETKALPQVKELLTNYQPAPAIIWYDTPSKEMTPEIAAKFVTLMNQHPDLIWNNRLGGGYGGDTETPEQHIPPQGYPGKDWETCMTINGTWGYKSNDTNFKSTETLLHNLIDIASKGGNYLLNVGPDATGVIPQPEQDRLKEIGQWLSVNGEAIYGCGPTPFGAEAGSFSPTEVDKKGKPVFKQSWNWRATTQPGKIYLHLFTWPQPEKSSLENLPLVGSSFKATHATFHLDQVTNTVTGAYLLSDTQHAPLPFTQEGQKVALTLPLTAPDPLATVIVLEIK